MSLMKEILGHPGNLRLAASCAAHLAIKDLIWGGPAADDIAVAMLRGGLFKMRGTGPGGYTIQGDGS